MAEIVTAIGNDTTVVEFDANLNEVATVAASPTGYPVEDGSNITDHVIDEPDEIQIDAVISNTPANLTKALSASPTRAEDLYADLLLLKESRDVVSVFTSKAEYSDMIIARLARTRNAAVGDAAQFSISLRKIRKMQSSVAEVPLREKGGKGKKKGLGTVVNEPADEKQRQTLGRKIVAAATGR